MQEPKRGVSEDESPEKELKQRKSDATSKETLEDLEEGQKISGSSDASDESIPSPDGQANEHHRDRADGSDTSGPM